MIIRALRQTFCPPSLHISLSLLFSSALCWHISEYISIALFPSKWSEHEKETPEQAAKRKDSTSDTDTVLDKNLMVTVFYATYEDRKALADILHHFFPVLYWILWLSPVSKHPSNETVWKISITNLWGWTSDEQSQVNLTLNLRVSTIIRKFRKTNGV